MRGIHVGIKAILPCRLAWAQTSRDHAPMQQTKAAALQIYSSADSHLYNPVRSPRAY